MYCPGENLVHVLPWGEPGTCTALGRTWYVYCPGENLVRVLPWGEPGTCTALGRTWYYTALGRTWYYTALGRRRTWYMCPGENLVHVLYMYVLYNKSGNFSVHTMHMYTYVKYVYTVRVVCMVCDMHAT